MKNTFLTLLAALGFPATVSADPYRGYTFQASLILQAQDRELQEEYDRCTDRIEEIDAEIAELEMEIPRLQKLARIQKVKRALTAPFRLLTA